MTSIKWLAIAFSFALLTLTGAFPAFAATSDDGLNPAEQAVHWTPVMMTVSSSPRAFQGSDHKWNLVYELVLNNYSPAPARIQELDVVDAGSDRKLLEIMGQALHDVLSMPSKPGKGIVELAPGQSAIVWVNLSFERRDDVPQKLVHVVSTSSRNLATRLQESQTNRGAEVTVDQRPPVQISAPLRGGTWIAIGGYQSKIGHRRTLFCINNGLYSAQRYAIDWLRMDEDNYSTRGATDKNESCAAYNQPVHAVADAVVYGVVSRYQEENIPAVNKSPDRAKYPGGNSITLDLGNGYYAFYAHLKPGTITVKPGDQVRRGDVIGHVGNSGNSTAPHLHFHVTDSPYILASNGVPYVFDDFTVVGQIDSLQKFLEEDLKARPHKLGQSPYAGRHENELITEGHAINFSPTSN
jgi:hypothetical protein